MRARLDPALTPDCLLAARMAPAGGKKAQTLVYPPLKGKSRLGVWLVL